MSESFVGVGCVYVRECMCVYSVVHMVLVYSKLFAECIILEILFPGII